MAQAKVFACWPHSVVVLAIALLPFLVWPGLLAKLLESTGFHPHGTCYLWKSELIWLHLISDSLIGLAYMSIPMTLIYFVRKRTDLPFHWMFICFGVFIIACGATHFMEIWTLWEPVYYLSGVVKAVTALASVPTAILLVSLIPAALALPSPSQLAQAKAEVERARDELELRVKERTAQLEAASRIKDEFLVTASHELRTPLHGILGWVEVLRFPEVDQNTKARALDTIERAVKAQLTPIEDILDLASLMRGELRLDMQQTDLVPLVAEALDTVRPALEAKQIHAELELHSETALIFGDPKRLRQVIWNLLSNALKFTPSGGSVKIELQCLESQARLIVSDTCEGIRADFLPHVFDRFRRADSSLTRKHRGMGLGLSIVRDLVEAHGGTVQAFSGGEGLGSVFTVILPLCQGGRRERARA